VSIAVGLDDLRRKIDELGTDPYLLTVGENGRAHSVAVPVRWSGDDLVVSAGNTTSANAVARPLVALLWAPSERGDFSLIVDATFVDRETTDAGTELTLRPTRAVLHRPAPSGTGSDCAPVVSSEGV
jgi:hypothetical protein